MREYFSHARNIHLITQSAIERMSVVPEKSGFFGILRPKAGKIRRLCRPGRQVV